VGELLSHRAAYFRPRPPKGSIILSAAKNPCILPFAHPTTNAFSSEVERPPYPHFASLRKLRHLERSREPTVSALRLSHPHSVILSEDSRHLASVVEGPRRSSLTHTTSPFQTFTRLATSSNGKRHSERSEESLYLALRPPHHNPVISSEGERHPYPHFAYPTTTLSS
jgi:hypothetical protein